MALYWYLPKEPRESYSKDRRVTQTTFERGTSRIQGTSVSGDWCILFTLYVTALQQYLSTSTCKIQSPKCTRFVTCSLKVLSPGFHI
jgi:hypothetical protein